MAIEEGDGHLQEVVGGVGARAEDEDEGGDVDGVVVGSVEVEGRALREVVADR